ncbi:MAG: menaquinone biosynthesis decarboxylase [Bacteroides sp.]
MKISGLLNYLNTLDKKKQLLSIETPCNPQLEITEISHRLFANGLLSPILFQTTGTQFPVVTNLYANPELLLQHLQLQNLEQLQERISSTFTLLTTPPNSTRAKLKILRLLYDIKKLLPNSRKKKAPVQECISLNPDLNLLPILKSWPHDAERFITLPMVITQDPISGKRNVGMYRMQVLDKQTTAMHWHIHKTGAKHFAQYKALKQKMPVAVALGGDPILAYAATAPLPEGIDEFLFAGFLRKKKVTLVDAITIPLKVPAEADFILEGYIDPDEPMQFEGPFGDHTGFYSLEDWYPRFHLTCITHRKNAIYPATIVGIPPMEDSIIAQFTERIFAPLIRNTLIPELSNFTLPTPGVAHNLALIHSDNRYAGSALKVANAIWSAGQMMFTKYIIRLPNNCSFASLSSIFNLLLQITEQDLFFTTGPLDVLDHAGEHPTLGSKLFIDTYNYTPADLPFRWERTNTNNENSTTLWVGTTPLLYIIETTSSTPLNSEYYFAAYRNNRTIPPKFIALVDPAYSRLPPYYLLWILLANTAPKRDIALFSQNNQLHALIDARAKMGDAYKRAWPNVVTSNPETIKLISSRWNEYKLPFDCPPSPSCTFLPLIFNTQSATASKKECP